MSEDNRTYVAAKIIPGFATMVYMAVTNTPEDGWEKDGFVKIASYIPNININEILSQANEEERNRSSSEERSNNNNNLKVPNDDLRRASNLSTANYYDAKQNAVGQDDNLINF
jgi:hypothetical protein